MNDALGFFLLINPATLYLKAILLHRVFRGFRLSYVMERGGVHPAQFTSLPYHRAHNIFLPSISNIEHGCARLPIDELAFLRAWRQTGLMSSHSKLGFWKSYHQIPKAPSLQRKVQWVYVHKCDTSPVIGAFKR